MNYFNNFKVIKKEIEELIYKPNLILVTKNQSIDTIYPFLEAGHIHFGENKVQEASQKWSNILKNNSKVKLHLIGKLQSNKAKEAFNLFDFIHTLDSEKLAKILSSLENNSERKIKYFIQVNIGNEMQKNGIDQSSVRGFVDFCCKDLKLNIIGLMCIPPFNLDPVPFFKKMKDLKIINNLNELSMGMSSDYKQALNYGATYIRIGSAIFK
jgi:pyridoxal phosphate enzyme (YggS family)